MFLRGNYFKRKNLPTDSCIQCKGNEEKMVKERGKCTERIEKNCKMYYYKEVIFNLNELPSKAGYFVSLLYELFVY